MIGKTIAGYWTFPTIKLGRTRVIRYRATTSGNLWGLCNLRRPSRFPGSDYPRTNPLGYSQKLATQLSTTKPPELLVIPIQISKLNLNNTFHKNGETNQKRKAKNILNTLPLSGKTRSQYWVFTGRTEPSIKSSMIMISEEDISHFLLLRTQWK